MNSFGQTICLNMIVKNEAHVIRRCLDSVRPLIDHWVIVDTGSTDATPDIIREHLRDIPGDLVQRPWVNFAHNRTEALQLARGRADYLFTIDADEIVEFSPGFILPRLTADSYNLEMLYGGFSYMRKQLARNDLPWRYTGVLHEYIHCDEAKSEETLSGLRTVPRHDGARARDPQTYRRDALLLEQTLLEEPDNPRNQFYLAQSYRDAGDPELALRHYRRRVEMGGWSEEIWFSLYQIAQLKEKLDKPWPEVMQDYLAAYQYRPDRAGPLFRIGLHHQAKGEYAIAHLFFSRAMFIPYPATSRLFVERDVYDYLLPVEYAVAAYYVGDHAAAIETNNTLLCSGKLPPQTIDQVVRNRRFSLQALHPQRSGAAPGRVHIIVPFRDPGPDLDETIESLLRQESADCDFTLVADGSRADLRERIPNDPRLTLVCRSSHGGCDLVVADFVERCGGRDDVVVPIQPGQRLAASDTVAQIAASFGDPGCLLLYGQYRLANGCLGTAEPAASEAQFSTRGYGLAGASLLAFRPALWRQAQVSTSGVAVDAAALWRSAGFAGTCFHDDVLTVMAVPGSGPSSTFARPLRLPSALAALAQLPMISCLMVTRDRLALAKRSIRCFADQSYPNRELVIVCENNEWYRRALERQVADLGIQRFCFVSADAGAPLGRLRNQSLQAASGAIVCQWDDDDGSHPDRLMVQAEHMFSQNARACFLTDHLQFLEQDRLLSWIDWTMDGQISDERQLFPGTVMMFKDARFSYPESGPYARRGEDSALLNQLCQTVPIARLSGMGHLYLYQFHGRNTFPKEHHYHIATCGASNQTVLARADKIREAVQYFSIAKPVAVLGKNGPAFSVG